MIPLNLIVLVRRTIDNRRGKLLTRPMNRVTKGDSVKRGVGRLSIRSKRTDETNDSVTSHTVTINNYIIFILLYVLYNNQSRSHYLYLVLELYAFLIVI